MSQHCRVKYLRSKNRRVQEVGLIEANCHVRLSNSKTILKYLSGKIFIIKFTNKKTSTLAIIKNPIIDCRPTQVHNCCNKEKDAAVKCRRPT